MSINIRMMELEDGEMPQDVPKLVWVGRVTTPLVDYVTSLMAVGYSDARIQEMCETYFGGPATTATIHSIRRNYAPVLAQKIEDLSKQTSSIPVAHKTYRIMLLNELATDLADGLRNASIVGDSNSMERMARTLIKTLDAARVECEGDGESVLNQQNIYYTMVNSATPEQLDRIASTLSSAKNDIEKMLGDGVQDAEFEELENVSE